MNLLDRFFVEPFILKTALGEELSLTHHFNNLYSIRGYSNRKYFIKTWDQYGKLYESVPKVGETYLLPKTDYQLEFYIDGKLSLQTSFRQLIKGKPILFCPDSFCLGDSIAWFGYLEDYFEKYQPSHLTVTTFWPGLFQSPRKEISIIPARGGKCIGPIYNIHTYGYDKENINHRKKPIQKVISDFIGIPYVSKRPLISISPTQKYPFEDQDKKYVTIAPESLKPIARWHYPNGWQQVIDYIKSKPNWEVVLISKEKTIELTNCIDHRGDYDISQRISEIYHSQYFIGVSSGLSWLAWACKKPVLMISGFTEPFNEFDCYRVYPTDPKICCGCWNKSLARSQCPHHLDTPRQWECSYNITPEMVYEQINLITKSINN